MGAHPSHPIQAVPNDTTTVLPKLPTSDSGKKSRRSGRKSSVLHIVGQGRTSAHGVTENGFGGVGVKEPIQYAGNIIGASKDQDRFVCVPKLLKSVFFAGIFDGHGVNGETRAEQASSLIPKWIQEEVRSQKRVKENGEIDICIESVKEGIEKSFSRMQEYMADDYRTQILEPAIAIKKQIEEESKVDLGTLCLPQDGGTTATIVVVVNDVLLVAWVGDSRAVLAKQCVGDAPVKGIVLTTDHNISNASKEVRERVEKLGGQLTDKHIGLDNVEGMLQLTRSLGDTPFHRDDVVQSTPEFVEMKIDSSCHFLIIASDGLWDHFSCQEAVEYVDAQLKKLQSELSPNENTGHDILHEVTRQLEEAALERAKEAKVRSDDISVFIAVLHASATAANS